MRVAIVTPGGVNRSGRIRIMPALMWLIERLSRRHTVHAFVMHFYPEACTHPMWGATIHNLGPAKGPAGLRMWNRVHGFMLEIVRSEPFDLLHGFWVVPPDCWQRLPDAGSVCPASSVSPAVDW